MDYKRDSIFLTEVGQSFKELRKGSMEKTIAQEGFSVILGE